MKALPEAPFETPFWQECTVHGDHYFIFQKSFFSMPTRYIGKNVWVRGCSRTIRVFLEEKLIKSHLPAPYPGFDVLIPRIYRRQKSLTS